MTPQSDFIHIFISNILFVAVWRWKLKKKKMNHATECVRRPTAKSNDLTENRELCAQAAEPQLMLRLSVLISTVYSFSDISASESIISHERVLIEVDVPSFVIRHSSNNQKLHERETHHLHPTIHRPECQSAALWFTVVSASDEKKKTR